MSPKTEPLKPCPCCSAPALIHAYREGQVGVACTNLDCGLRNGLNDLAVVVERWNRRTSPPPAAPPEEADAQVLRDVWLVEPAEYDSFVTGVFATAEAAIAGIKAPYDADPLYVVQWKSDEWQDADTVLVRAHFEAVVGRSTRHDACWEIKRWKVEGGPPDAARSVPSPSAPRTTP